MKNFLYIVKDTDPIEDEESGINTVKEEDQPEIFIERDILGLEKPKAVPASSYINSNKLFIGIGILLLSLLVVFLIAAGIDVY